MPNVRLANTENSISEEFRIPHSSFVNPLMDMMKAWETKTSKSIFKSES